MKSAVSVLFLSVLASFSSVSAFAKTSQESINFSKGADQKIQTGSFKGYDDIQYKIYAKKGQTLKFKINSNKNLANINIFSPNNKPGKNEAIFIGSTGGQTGVLILPSSGEYTIQVYQMRNTARQNKKVNFQLNIQIQNGPKHIAR